MFKSAPDGMSNSVFEMSHQKHPYVFRYVLEVLRKSQIGPLEGKTEVEFRAPVEVSGFG